MYTIERFVEDCRAARRQDGSHVPVAELTRKLMSDPSSLVNQIGTPDRAGLTPLYHSSDLTILNVVWKPLMMVQPHNHEMWAVIGIYGGREDNIFWRRVADDPSGHIEAAGAKALTSGDVAQLGKDIIHSVSNPIDQLSGAIHIYGGDFFEAERSEWDAENLTERPIDLERVKAQFSD